MFTLNTNKLNIQSFLAEILLYIFLFLAANVIY